MNKIVIASILILSSCVSKAPQSNGEKSYFSIDDKSLDLKTALTQNQELTLTYFKSQLEGVSAYAVDKSEPLREVPEGLRVQRSVSSVSQEKSQQGRFLRQFRSWSFNKKTEKAEALLSSFSCGDVVESQSLGYSLERNFPETEAMRLSMALHEKVLTCPEYAIEDSLFRLTAFSLAQEDCTKAKAYITQFPKSLAKGLQDRVAYLASFCPHDEKTPVVGKVNPWGGYGVMLADLDTLWSSSVDSKWYLQTKSGSEEWDRFLATLVDLTDKKESEMVKYLAHKLDYEAFTKLPVGYQTSVLVLLSLNGADLAVFQAVHKYLSENGDDSSPEIAQLLFPIRYWSEITKFTEGTVDPVLVKSLIRQESAFDPHAKSRVKASGLMQLMYSTARLLGVKNKKDLAQPEVNIRAGSRYLNSLIEEFGSVELALAAYNAGPGVVREWKSRYPTKDINLFVEMIPYSETRAYVRLVLRNYKIYQTVLLKNQVPDVNLSKNNN